MTRASTQPATRHSWRALLAIGGLLALGASGTLVADGGKKAKPAGSGAFSFAVDPGAVPHGDPCRLLANSDVHKAFPKTSGVDGSFDHSAEMLGRVACIWDYPSGRVGVMVSLDATPGGSKDAAEMFADPVAMTPNKNIRYEKIAGIGDEATAVAEDINPSQNIKRTLAVIATQRGKQQIIIVSNHMPAGDRADALKTLEDLARTAVSHL